MTATPPWIGVGELEEAFLSSSNVAPTSGDLARTSRSLHFQDGRVIDYRFQTDHQLAWNIISGDGRGKSAEEEYSASKIREGIYLVDYIDHLERATSVTFVLDMNCGIFIAVVGQLPTEAEARQDLLSRVAANSELTSVKATFLSGAIDKPFDAETPHHRVTAEMVGRRVDYVYSQTERYEHIYLNENFYTWQCLLGNEKGLADTDRCHYYKLAENLYLFVWREKIIPTLGVVAVDFDAMRSNGKIFGYQGNDFQRLSNFRVGAAAWLLNITRRD